MSKRDRRPVHVKDAPGRVTTTATDLRAVAFSGPLPPPAILEGYEAIKPGYADRIMRWTEDESAHRRRMEWRAQSCEHGKDVFGMLLAFILSAGVLGGGIYLLLHDKPLGGIAAMVGALAPLVGAFYISRRRQ